MFDELPETNPVKNERKPRAIAAAILLQAALVSTVILIQMTVPQRFGGFQLLPTTTAAAPPPLGQLLQQPHPPSKESPAKISHKAETPAPLAEPEPPKTEETVPEGIAQGDPQGAPGGIAGGVPGENGDAVRVGGNIRPPRIIKLVKPAYPAEAIHAHVEGVVLLEATVTATGDVIDVKVISGPPMLIPAAIKAVEEWKYEPTIINGRPVPVILTATVNFSLKNRLH
jgi:periplasmic protein TonB